MVHCLHPSSFLFEVWLLLRTISLGISMIAVTLLVQDKICVNQYHQTAQYCVDISHQSSASVEAANVRDDILADSAKFSNYKNLIECIPMVLWSLFVGSFLDSYAGGTKLIMILGNVGDLVSIALYSLNVFYFQWNANLVLLPSVVYWLTGGLAAFFTVCFRYIVVTTDERSRPIKFMFFQLVAMGGLSLGTFLGGFLIVATDASSAQPRTYFRSFAVFFVFDVAALVITFWLKSANVESGEPVSLNDGCETDLEESQSDETHSLLSDANNNCNYETLSARESIVSLGKHSNRHYSTNSANPESNRSVVSRLFNLSNVRETVVCFVKPRARHVRLQIYLQISILFCTMLISFGVSTVMFQFSEKVYQWTSTQYTTFSSLSTIVSNVVMALATGLLVKVCKSQDSTLLLLSLLSTFGNQLILGTFMSSAAYFAGLMIGSLNNLGSIAIRNKISKIIPQDEVGRIFSLVSTIEATLPFFGSLIYTYMFAATISTYTGGVFQFGAGLMVFSLILMVFQELYCRD